MTGKCCLKGIYGILIAQLVLMLLSTGVSRADNSAPPELAAIDTLPAETVSTPSPDNEIDEDATADDTSNPIGEVVDETHDVLERNILEQVIHLDDFFGNPLIENQQKATYQLRWQNFIRIEKEGRLKFGTNIRANIQLSRINNRLNLVFYGEDEPEPTSSSLPEDPGSPGFDRSFRSMRIANTELRYGLLHTPSMDLFLGAGVRLIIPPEAFVRSRFQYTHKISNIALLRCAETLFVKNFNIFGETTEISLERLLTQKTLLRWANTGTLSDEIKGMELGSELSLIRELSPQSGITLTGGVYGNSSSIDTVSNYRILARYRRNFLRSWLFYELEPEVSWQRRADGSFPANVAFTVRIEILFQGREK